MHMAAARLGCKRLWLALGGPILCISRLRKHYSHLSGASFLAGKASWVLSECLPTKSADYIACSLMSGHG